MSQTYNLKLIPIIVGFWMTHGSKVFGILRIQHVVIYPCQLLNKMSLVDIYHDFTSHISLIYSFKRREG